MGSEVIKIANCSGYYGDRLSAAKEMVEGGPIDVLTGDYLAELTMTILFNQKLKRGDDKGYVGTFLKQLKDVAKTCKEKEIKIVTNAGGLNPKSMANEIEIQCKNYVNRYLSSSLEIGSVLFDRKRQIRWAGFHGLKQINSFGLMLK